LKILTFITTLVILTLSLNAKSACSLEAKANEIAQREQGYLNDFRIERRSTGIAEIIVEESSCYSCPVETVTKLVYEIHLISCEERLIKKTVNQAN
jgi:hypothetical protein